MSMPINENRVQRDPPLSYRFACRSSQIGRTVLLVVEIYPILTIILRVHRGLVELMMGLDARCCGVYRERELEQGQALGIRNMTVIF